MIEINWPMLALDLRVIIYPVLLLVLAYWPLESYRQVRLWRSDKLREFRAVVLEKRRLWAVYLEMTCWPIFLPFMFFNRGKFPAWYIRARSRRDAE